MLSVNLTKSLARAQKRPSRLVCSHSKMAIFKSLHTFGNFFSSFVVCEHFLHQKVVGSHIRLMFDFLKKKIKGF